MLEITISNLRQELQHQASLLGKFAGQLDNEKKQRADYFEGAAERLMEDAQLEKDKKKMAKVYEKWGAYQVSNQESLTPAQHLHIVQFNFRACWAVNQVISQFADKSDWGVELAEHFPKLEELVTTKGSDAQISQYI